MLGYAAAAGSADEAARRRNIKGIRVIAAGADDFQESLAGI